MLDTKIQIPCVCEWIVAKKIAAAELVDYPDLIL